MVPLKNALISAYKAYQERKYFDAELSIQNILNHHPNQVDTLALGAIIARYIGAPFLGIDRIRAALKISPTNFEYLNSYGNLLSDIGDFPNAETEYLKSLKINSSYISAKENLAFMYIASSNSHSAITWFEELTASHPNHTNYRLALAQCYKDCLKFEEARNVLDTFDQTVKESNEYKIILAQLHYLEGKLESAITINKSILESDQKNGIALVNIAQIYHTENLHSKLVELLELLIETPALDWPLFKQMFVISYQIDRDDLCEEFCNIYDRETGDPNLNSLRALMHLKSEDYENAWVYSRKYLSTKPNDIEVLSTYVQAALKLEKNDEAKKAVSLARTLAPFNQYWIAMEAIVTKINGENHTKLFDYENFVQSFKVYDPRNGDFKELDRLKSYLTSLHESKEEPMNQSLKNGTQTSRDLRYINHPTVKNFWKKASPFIETYLSEIGQDSNHPFLNRNVKGYRSAGAWSVRLKGNGFHKNHVHPQGWISGVFYLDVPDCVNSEGKAGWIKFGEPSFKINNVNAEHYIKPEPGVLVLFPSYMWHGTIPIDEESERITLSFDLVPSLNSDDKFS